MQRRDFLKYASAAALATSMPGMQLWAAPQDFSGQFFVFIQANAGWDVTSFCDPKQNIDGQEKINNWADTQSTQQAGNIPYAPFANNQSFFESMHDRMLVVNGINTATNSHMAGRDYNFTGNIATGYPSLSALYASVHSDGFAMPCIVNGGHFRAAGVVTPTLVGRNDDTLKSLINPNQKNYGNSATSLPKEDYELVKSFQLRRAHQKAQDSSLMPRQAKNQQDFLAAVSSQGGFESFAELLDSIEPGKFDLNNRFNKQALYAILGFKAGLTVSADLNASGFDSHSNHDEQQAEALGGLTDGIECLWFLAEQLGIANRLTVMVASDFSRTPKYNSKKGKDHWPIGSTIFMQKDAPWANKVIGKTDDSHQALKINPESLIPDDKSGIEITPKHVMQSARQLLGIEQHENAFSFGLDVQTNINLFAS